MISKIYLEIYLVFIAIARMCANKKEIKSMLF